MPLFRDPRSGSLRHQPGTEPLDRTGAGAGGGGGTVTSVAGGVGITNAPEPIVGAGTVDLDINSLTSEPTPASGDLLAFVDISVGTAPSAQRKATIAQVVAAAGSGLTHQQVMARVSGRA